MSKDTRLVPLTLLAAALDVATDAPVRASEYGYLFNVRRSNVETLRREFEAVGVDWKSICKQKHRSTK